MNDSEQKTENIGSPVAGPTKNQPGDLRCAAGRPLAALVFGIFNIIFGCIGLVFSSIVIIHILIAWEKSGAALGYRLFLLAANAIGLGFSIWLFTLGMGLLAVRNWARRGSILYGWLGILFFIIESGVNFLAAAFNWLKIPEYAGRITPEGLREFLIGMGIGAAGGLVYPLLLLIFMQTKKVKEAF
jgi:hypothetical protein